MSSSAPSPADAAPSDGVTPPQTPPQTLTEPAEPAPATPKTTGPAFERSAWLPTSRLGWLLAAAGAVALIAYVRATMLLRLELLPERWSADGDQNQAVWHYWRYHISGAFPSGDLLTDYAFAMHAPPVWWALMASLSTFLEPVDAAKALNVFAYIATIVVIVIGVSRRSNVFVGLTAGFLLARSIDFHGIIAGGYARSFGPMLTLLFVGVFMAGRHRLALAVLVFQAAFYPSVVIPCGIAYGLYTVVAGPMPMRIRRMAGMFVAGLLIIGFGKSQDLVAKDWWGPIVTEKEALTMPAWGPGGRITEAPLKPVNIELRRNSARAFRIGGETWVEAKTTNTVHNQLPELVVVGSIGLVAVFGVLAWRRRREDEPVIDPFPWQLPLLIVGMLVAYFLARALAFKLYLPYRALQHVFPYVIYAGLPLLLWAIFVNALPRRRWLATALTVVLAVVPTVALFGDGMEKGPATYARYKFNEKLYGFVRKLPQGAMIAGDFVHTSSIPLFAHHNVYINKNLTHPFRTGFYQECERRILESYSAIYATSLADVVDFARREKIDYLAYRADAFTKKDNRLFQPVKRTIDALFTKNKARGFALAKPPKGVVVFRGGNSVVIDLKKLATWVEKNPTPTTPTTPTTPIPDEPVSDAPDEPATTDDPPDEPVTTD